MAKALKINKTYKYEAKDNSDLDAESEQSNFKYLYIVAESISY